MAASPKEIEQKIDRVLGAWESLAPSKSFGGMTLALPWGNNLFREAKAFREAKPF